jgi:hypothetical protein
MKAVVKAEPKLSDYFRTTTSRRQFLAEEEVAHDVERLLAFEEGFDCKSTAVLLACWRMARDSYQRVMEMLPCGPLRDQMAIELADRDESMNRLAEHASEMLKVAENA